MKDTLEILKRGKRFLLCTHFLPDGDGLGSQMALHYALESLGKQSTAMNPSPTPEKFSLVDPRSRIQVFRPGKSLPSVDAILILDTHELKMMEAMRPALEKLGAPIVFLDHHVPDNLSPGPHFVDESFAATGELVFALLKGLGVSLNLEIATALYVAILTDTAGFRYKRTSPALHRVVAELLECGVSPEKVFRAIFARESVAKTRLLGHALAALKTEAKGRVAWIRIRATERKRFGATVEDTESFIGRLTLLHGAEIVALFREEGDGEIKISLRGLGETPVVEIARQFGGGGHRFAAGARIDGKLATIEKKVIAACVDALP